MKQRAQSGLAPSSGSDEAAEQKQSNTLSTRGIRLRYNIAGCVSDRYIIRKLEQELQEKQASLAELAEANNALRTKEKVLMDAVTANSANLHYIAMAAFSHSKELHSDTAGLVANLMQDVKVHEMLKQLGTVSSQDEPYTTQCMRAAVTPERIKQMQAASLEEVVQHIRNMTTSMAMMLQAEHEGLSSQSSLSSSLDQLVDEYAEYTMLVHVAADRLYMEICGLSLETMQLQDPPEGHWEKLLQRLQLRPEQEQRLCAGFQVYASRSEPLVASIHELVQNMLQLTASMQGAQFSQAASAASAAAPAAAPAAAATAAAQRPPAAASTCSSCSSDSGVSGLGDRQHSLAHVRSMEGAEELEQLLCQLVAKVMKLRELHRTMIMLWINTLTRRQHAINITSSYPHISQTLTICKLLTEKQAAAVNSS